jgi:hypothetical protein
MAGSALGSGRAARAGIAFLSAAGGAAAPGVGAARRRGTRAAHLHNHPGQDQHRGGDHGPAVDSDHGAARAGEMERVGGEETGFDSAAGGKGKRGAAGAVGEGVGGGGGDIAADEGCQCGGAEGHAAAFQPGTQDLSAAREMTPDRADRPAEAAGGFLVGTTFQIAQHQRRPVFLRQPTQFLVKQPGHLVELRGPFVLLGDVRERLDTAAGQASAFLACDPAGDAVEPVADGGLPAERSRTSGEHEEGCLVSILGRVPVAQDTQADAEHHSAMALQDFGEGRFVALAREAVEQLRIREPERRGPHQTWKLAKDRTQRGCAGRCHTASGRGVLYGNACVGLEPCKKSEIRSSTGKSAQANPAGRPKPTRGSDVR